MTTVRGRPRSFDAVVALDNALAVFWRNGYQGASLSELTSAMSLSKPSLYAAFGDKEALYLRCLERYVATRLRAHAAVLTTEADGRRAIQAFLRSMVAMLTDAGLPGGCFVITGNGDCGLPTTPMAVEVTLKGIISKGEAELHNRLLQAQRDGQLPRDLDAGQLAAYFNVLLAGLAVHARSGATRTKLDSVVDAAMAAWPVTAERDRKSRASRVMAGS